MTAPVTRGAWVRRWGAAALACAALAAFARPVEVGARRASSAESFGEYLALRARPPALERDPLRPLLAARFVSGPAAQLLFGRLVDDTVQLDDCAGIMPRALGATFAAPDDPARAEPISAQPVLMLGCDEAGLAPGFDAALAAAFALPVISGAARGQSPLGHIGLVERASHLRVAAIVSVWNLANDLGETELLRRLQTRLPPGGPIDPFLAALRDPARAEAAQETWFAGRDEAADAVVAVLAGAGFELDRRARLHGGRAVVVLLGLAAPGPEPTALPRTTRMAEALERDLRARGVRVTALSAAPDLRTPDGRLTTLGIDRVVASARTALE